MLNITIHGIGQHQKDYGNKWELKEALKRHGVGGEVLYFFYDDILDKSNLTWFSNMIRKVLASLISK